MKVIFQKSLSTNPLDLLYPCFGRLLLIFSYETSDPWLRLVGPASESDQFCLLARN